MYVREEEEEERRRKEGGGQISKDDVVDIVHYLSHGVHRALTQLMGQVITLDKTDAVFALYQRLSY